MPMDDNVNTPYCRPDFLLANQFLPNTILSKINLPSWAFQIVYHLRTQRTSCTHSIVLYSRTVMSSLLASCVASWGAQVNRVLGKFGKLGNKVPYNWRDLKKSEEPKPKTTNDHENNVIWRLGISKARVPLQMFPFQRKQDKVSNVITSFCLVVPCLSLPTLNSTLRKAVNS